MRSTFYGFEAAKSGMNAAQAGLDVTNNNVSNLNTPGYSRQYVQQSAVYLGSTSDKYASVELFPNGMGVNVDRIAQTRSEFLDLRYRTANTEDSANQKLLSLLTDISDNFDETQTNGLSGQIDDFYKQLQTLSLNAGEVEFSSLTRAGAQKVTQSFNQYARQLKVIRDQTIEEMDINIKDINTLLEKVDAVNYSIKSAILHDSPVNELTDTRSLYLDKLASYMNIDVTFNTDGTLDIESGGQQLLTGSGMMATVSRQDTGAEVALLVDGTEIEPTGGALYASLTVLNGKGGFAAIGENGYRGIPYYQEALDSMAAKFIEVFNGLNDVDQTDGISADLFSGSAAEDISISDEWLADANYLVSTLDADGEKGKNDNILRMIAAMDADQDIGTTQANFSDYLVSLMSDIAIDVSYTTDVSETSGMILTSVDNQRESVMGVSLNEETVNLIKYQKAFAASARVINALDEALNTIINNMGLVGR